MSGKEDHLLNVEIFTQNLYSTIKLNYGDFELTDLLTLLMIQLIPNWDHYLLLDYDILI